MTDSQLPPEVRGRVPGPTGAQQRDRLPLDVARRSVRDEPLGALPRLDRYLAPAIRCRLLGDDQHHDSCVPPGIAHSRARPDAPLAPDAQRNVRRLAPAYVRHGHDRDLTP